MNARTAPTDLARDAIVLAPETGNDLCRRVLGVVRRDAAFAKRHGLSSETHRFSAGLYIGQTIIARHWLNADADLQTSVMNEISFLLGGYLE